MNNSKIAFDNLEEETDDKVEALQDQAGELAQIVEAINRVEVNPDWQKLKKLVLDDVVVSLERQLSTEASKINVDPPTLYRLQGQLAWARKYADIKKLGEVFKKSLVNIKNQINGKTNPRDGAL